MSLFSKFRSRRAIQRKLDEVTRIFNGESGGPSVGITECAIVTEGGDILTSKAGSPKPFVEIAPKVRRLRASADRVGTHLLQKRDTAMHIRGASTMVSTYDLGVHTLVAVSELGTTAPDAAIARIDDALGVDGDAEKLIDALTRLLDDI